MHKIIGISGSIRKVSYNKALLNYVEDLSRDNFIFEAVDISKLPLFNEDLENDLPEEVVFLKEKMKDADAFIIASPEYNQSITGVLKNALDWLSRGDLKVLHNKPLAIMSASPSMFGGIRAQPELKKICSTFNMDIVNKLEVSIIEAHKRIDLEGNVTDQYTREAIKALVTGLLNKIK